MAVGQQLTAPETGWRRYDDIDSRIIYRGTWSTTTDTNTYNNGIHYSNNINDNFTFSFYGTKLRLIATLWSGCSNNIKVTIDGIDYTCIQNNPSTTYKTVFFEKTDLSLGKHVVIVTNIVTGQIDLDAIDMDDTGYLVHPILNQVSNLLGMTVGDCIPCRYTATTSGSAGIFSELGTCTAAEIPVTGTATPNGLFYLIKTDKSTLVADRVLQTNINWDTLNTAKFIEGNLIINSVIPIMSGYNNPSNYTISVVTGNDSNGPAWNAFSANSATYCGLFGSATNYIQISLPTAKCIKLVSILFKDGGWTSTSPISWIFQGSNDGTNWDTLDTQTNLPIWTTNEVRNFIIKNTNEYRYYRFYSILNRAGSTNGIVAIGKIYLSESLKLVRSLSGGCAYADANGNKSTTDQSKGGWPTINEWDKYIVKSTLNGKVTAGDDNIWHWKSVLWGTLCKDTPSNLFGTVNDKRILRGSNLTQVNKIDGLDYCPSAQLNTTYGFRPVLEYIEPDGSSKQTTLWY